MRNTMDPLTLGMLNKQDWDKVLLELEASVIRFLHFSGGAHKLPRGLQPRDIAFGAVASLYTQERKWDYNRYPNVGKFLFYSIVRSQLNHLYDSMDSKMLSRLVDKPLFEDDYDAESVKPVEYILSETSSSFEDEFIAQDLADKIMSGLGSDKTAQEVFQLKMAGCKDVEMSRRLEISVGEVRAASKRIARVGKKLLPKER